MKEEKIHGNLFYEIVEYTKMKALFYRGSKLESSMHTVSHL